MKLLENSRFEAINSGLLVEMGDSKIVGRYVLGRSTLETPHPARSAKLSKVRPYKYLDGLSSQGKYG